MASKTKKIVNNSILMYIRMAVVMIIKLYTLKVVLEVLGVEDYGIYNVIAGVVTMSQSVTSMLSTSTQRFYSYAQGQKDELAMQDIYNISFNLFIIFAIIILIFGETVGLWFVNTHLILPTDRMIASNWLYQFSIVSFCLTMLQIPYISAVIAHEDLKFFAIINTLESIIILVLVSLIKLITYDHLILYGLAMLLVPLITTASYIVLSKMNYREIKRANVRRKKYYKDILSFSGWTMFSPMASVGINEVCTILINIYFGPVINGARAIAFQLSNALNSFCSSFLVAIRPAMIKNYAEENYEYLNTLFYMSNKFLYYSLLVFCVPIYFEMNSILGWWLHVNDETTVLFSRLILIYVIIMSLNNPIGFIVQATGNMKNYTIFVETFTLLCMPITYILFSLGYPAYTTFITMIICAICSHIVRMICLKKLYHSFSYREYIINFIVKAVLITAIVVTGCALAHYNLTNEIIRLFVVTAVSVILSFIAVYMIGLSHSEKCAIVSMAITIKNKIKS